MDKTTRDERPDDESTTTWLYTHRGETHGPVSSIDLRAAAHLGFLGPDDLVCRTDRERWVSARSVRGLFKPAR